MDITTQVKNAHDWLDILDLVGDFETPIIVTDVNRVRRQCHLFKQYFPDTKLYYAVKCLPESEVIQSIDDLVDGYDAASVPEIHLILSKGVNPARIGFSNPVKSCEAIKEAAQLGVSRFAYQSKGELDKIAHCAPGSSVYLRVRMRDAEAAISFSAKFGCKVSEADELLEAATDLGLKPIGVTFHVGSQARDAAAWQEAILTAGAIAKQASRRGVRLEMINIGGGFPVMYDENDPAIDVIAHSVNGAIEQNDLKTEYLAEPGRFLTADSSAIVATVIGVEDRKDSSWLFLDVGAFQAFFEIFEFGNFPYPVFSMRHLENRSAEDVATKHYVLTGPTCDSFDTMALDVVLPANIQVGDELLFTMTGAYTTVYGSNFNGFNIPTRIFVDTEQPTKEVN